MMDKRVRPCATHHWTGSCTAFACETLRTGVVSLAIHGAVRRSGTTGEGRQSRSAQTHNGQLRLTGFIAHWLRVDFIPILIFILSSQIYVLPRSATFHSRYLTQCTIALI
jgi:hypothetical protein